MVVLGEPVSELAHVRVGSLETLVRSHDPHVVPHRVLKSRPVLQDEGRIFHVLVAGRLPVGDGLQQRLVEAAPARLPGGVGAPDGRRLIGPGPLRHERARRDGDWLARSRTLALEQGDLLAIMSAGAYGMTMASNYNTRPRAAEVIVDGDKVHLVRERESVAGLFALESIIP